MLVWQLFFHHLYYAHQAHFDLTILTSLEIKNYSRRKCRTTLQETGSSTKNFAKLQTQSTGSKDNGARNRQNGS
jgi:hypothetical protein